MLRCISANLAASLFSFVCCKSSTTASYDLARINYYAMAPRRVNNRNLRVIPLFSQALYSLFRSISRHALLRHPRRRQLLHPSDSGPQTKGCPRMRHLWVRRTAHNQTFPSLWWLCTSPFFFAFLSLLWILNANSMSPSDVMQMTTNYCVSTSPCCRPSRPN